MLRMWQLGFVVLDVFPSRTLFSLVSFCHLFML